MLDMIGKSLMFSVLHLIVLIDKGVLHFYLQLLWLIHPISLASPS